MAAGRSPLVTECFIPFHKLCWCRRCGHFNYMMGRWVGSPAPSPWGAEAPQLQ